VLPADTGTFVVSGVDATFPLSRVFVAETGTFLVTLIPADTGSFVITGFVATLTDSGSDPILTAEIGAVLITGIAAGLARQIPISASPGAVVINGVAATLTKAKSISAEIGSVSVAGQIVTLEHHHVLPAETGIYSVVGSTAGLLHGKLIDALAGAYLINGQVANLEHHHSLIAETGAFLITGLDATLTVTGSIILTADAGSILVSGQDANLEQGYAVIAETGSFVITGVDANLIEGGTIILTAEAGSIIVSGQDANLEWNQDVVGGTGAFIITGIAANLKYNRSIDAVASSYLITGEEIRTIEVIPQVSPPDFGIPEDTIQRLSFSITLDLSDTNEFFKSSIDNDTPEAAAFIQGFTAATSPAFGWNNEVRDKATFNNVSRINGDLAAFSGIFSGYSITADERITITIPSQALIFGGPDIQVSTRIDILAAPDYVLTADAGSVVITGFDVANVIGPYQPLNEVSVFLESPLDVFINTEEYEVFFFTAAPLELILEKEYVVFIEQEVILFIINT